MSFRVCTIFDIGRLVDSYTALYENYLNNLCGSLPKLHLNSKFIKHRAENIQNSFKMVARGGCKRPVLPMSLVQ
jgi:hypothetical protein